MTPASVQPLQRSPIAGRAVAHLTNGTTYSGWVQITAGVVTIEGRLRTLTGPSHTQTYIYRAPVRRTYPVGSLLRIDWMEPSE